MTTARPRTALEAGYLALLPQDVPFDTPIKSVIQNKVYDFFGTYSTLISGGLHSATSFTLANTDDGETKPELLHQALTNFVAQAHTDYKWPNAACWLSIRMTTHYDKMVVPRWHRDGNYFDHDIVGEDPSQPSAETQQCHSKYATTLLGPSTLFLDLEYPLTANDLFLKTVPEKAGTQAYTTYLTGSEDIQTRGAMTEFFESHDVPVVVGGLGQTTRFACGPEYGVVHSEPDMSDRHRVFVSVLFGTEEQLKDLSVRWKREWIG